MNPNRREVLLTGLATALAGTMSAADAGAASSRRERLRAPDGELRLDGAATSAAADDFGHIVHRTPESVVLLASDEDVATAIRSAGRRGRRFAAQGQRHSVFGRAQVRGGIAGDMRRLRAIHAVEDDRIVVGGGATWREVLAATLPRGLTPPVLTDYLGLSVGGTLVVGGVGSRTARYGVQSDHVLELDVVTGTGEKLTCLPTLNGELFDAVRAGLGQVAVITRATLALIPAPRHVRRCLLTYRDLETMLGDGRRLVARFDSVQGAAVPTPAGWMFRLDAVTWFSGSPPDDDALLAGLSDDRSAAQLDTLPYEAYLDRFSALEQSLRSNGQWFLPHPWLTTFVGDSQVESLVGGELARLTAADLGPFGQIVLSPLLREAIASPLLRLPEDDLCHTFNLIRIPTTGDVAHTGRLVAANRAVYERVRAAGGTLYPVSALAMSREDWHRHFGPAFPRLREAKRRFDPRNVLTPGYEVF